MSEVRLLRIYNEKSKRTREVSIIRAVLKQVSPEPIKITEKLPDRMQYKNILSGLLKSLFNLSSRLAESGMSAMKLIDKTR
jgi:hypothetical protein